MTTSQVNSFAFLNSKWRKREKCRHVNFNFVFILCLCGTRNLLPSILQVYAISVLSEKKTIRWEMWCDQQTLLRSNNDLHTNTREWSETDDSTHQHTFYIHLIGRMNAMEWTEHAKKFAMRNKWPFDNCWWWTPQTIDIFFLVWRQCTGHFYVHAQEFSLSFLKLTMKTASAKKSKENKRKITNESNNSKRYWWEEVDAFVIK